MIYVSPIIIFFVSTDRFWRVTLNLIRCNMELSSAPVIITRRSSLFAQRYNELLNIYQQMRAAKAIIINN